MTMRVQLAVGTYAIPMVSQALSMKRQAFAGIRSGRPRKIIKSSFTSVQEVYVCSSRSPGQWKGEFVPERGSAVPLGRSEILLSVTGPRALVAPLQGAPRPLLLKLHRESTFQDLEYLAAQAYRFTALSWRSLFPSARPVTILYSDLIASLLGRLRHVRNWNPDILSTVLRNSRWFL